MVTERVYVADLQIFLDMLNELARDMVLDSKPQIIADLQRIKVYAERMQQEVREG